MVKAANKSLCCVRFIGGPTTTSAVERLKAAVHGRHPDWPVLVRTTHDKVEGVWKTIVVLEAPILAIVRQWSLGKTAAPVQALTRWLAAARAAYDEWCVNPVNTLLLDADALGADDTSARLEASMPGVFGPISPPLQDLPMDSALVLAARSLCDAHPQVGECLRLLKETGLTFSEPAPAMRLPHEPEGLTSALPCKLEDPRPMAATLPPAEATLLRACLADAQQELEDLYLQMRDLRSRAAGSATAGRRSLRAGHLRWTDVQPTMAAVDLRPLEVVGERSWPSVQAQLHLVDGQPALRILATGADPEVISAWRSDGTSNGRAYGEFRPYDAAGRQRLEHLGAADWDVVSGLATLLARDAVSMGEELPASIRLAAARLQRQLSEMPPRFRYDQLTVTEATGDASTLSLRFGNASFGQTDLGTVALDWSASRLAWRSSPDAPNLPLAHWPCDAAGQPAPAWDVPVAKGRDGLRSNAAAMAALSAQDQALVLGVLDALPAAAALASERAAKAHGGRDALAAALAAELRTASRSVRSGQLRHWLARAAAAAGLRRR